MKNKYPFWMRLHWRGPRPLTLRERIVNSDFNSMMKVIVNFDPRMAHQDRHYRRAYDYIKALRVKSHSDWALLAHLQDGMPYIGILEGMNWTTCLGHPVLRTKELHCSSVELAAHCLWHLTFYGFTPKEAHALFDDTPETFEEWEERGLLAEKDPDEETDTTFTIKEAVQSGLLQVSDDEMNEMFTKKEQREMKIQRKRQRQALFRYLAA